MSESKSASRRSLGSNLTKVAKHRIRDEEYVELPELTDEMLARAMDFPMRTMCLNSNTR